MLPGRGASYDTGPSSSSRGRGSRGRGRAAAQMSESDSATAVCRCSECGPKGQLITRGQRNWHLKKESSSSVRRGRRGAPPGGQPIRPPPSSQTVTQNVDNDPPNLSDLKAMDDPSGPFDDFGEPMEVVESEDERPSTSRGANRPQTGPLGQSTGDEPRGLPEQGPVLAGAVDQLAPDVGSEPEPDGPPGPEEAEDESDEDDQEGQHPHSLGPPPIFLDDRDLDDILPDTDELDPTIDDHHSSPQTDTPSPAGRNPLSTYALSHSSWGPRLWALLVVILNLHFHVGTRACNLLLAVGKMVFQQFELIGADDSMPTTLQTTFKRYGIHDAFTIHPMCPQCSRVYAAGTSSDTTCRGCSQPLFDVPQNNILLDTLIDWLPGTSQRKPAPKLEIGISPLSTLLTDFLSRSGIEEATEEWARKERSDDILRDIMDGRVWKTMTADDQSRFFQANLPDNELRLGFTLSLDWFLVTRTSYSRSHHSGVLSACCANLPPAHRYWVQNILPLAMTPGPKEPNSDQFQHLLEIIVDDLLVLYHDGIVIKTPAFPKGRRVRAALLAIVCDHPAMCKVLGCADKGHNHSPCPVCTISADSLHSDSSIRNTDPSLRTHAENKRLAYLYRDLKTDKERKDFHAKYGLRWSELYRLPYVDVIRMGVIDPMHNLLLGLVKTQWLNVWIEGNALRPNTDAGTRRELDVLHRVLREFETPPWVARLPAALGQPSAGSLSADEYRFIACVLGPITIPLVWDAGAPQAAKDFPKQVAKFKKDSAEYEQKKADYIELLAQYEARTDGEKMKKPKAPNVPKEPKRPRMQPEESTNFLKLSAALTLLLAPSISLRDLDTGDRLLREYILEFKRLYPLQMTYNHHWALHIRAFILDFGPVYGFWAFLAERLNFSLKQYRHNNWDRGQLELSLMRTFNKDALCDSMLDYVSRTDPSTYDGNMLERQVAQKIQGTMARGDRGAINKFTAAEEDRAQAKEDALVDTELALSSASERRRIPDDLFSPLIAFYNQSRPDLNVVHPSAKYIGDREVLQAWATFHDYILLRGRRLTPTTCARKGPSAQTRSALVRARINDSTLYGEVMHIFAHSQRSGHVETLAYVRWMQPSQASDSKLAAKGLWAAYDAILDVQIFKRGLYHLTSARDYPSIIPILAFECPISRIAWDNDTWITISLKSQGVTA